jgi:hypothetical protein
LGDILSVGDCYNWETFNMKPFSALGLALVLIAAAACGGSSSSPAVLTPTGTTTTDTFNGIVSVGGVSINNFTITVGGAVSVTLLSAGPPPTITMGLGIGTPSAGTCALLSGGSTLTTPGTTAQLSGNLAAGLYCVEVVDVGNAAGPISYTVSVAHT